VWETVGWETGDARGRRCAGRSSEVRFARERRRHRKMGDGGWVGEMGEGTVSAELRRPLLLLLSGMTMHKGQCQHAMRLGLELVRCDTLSRGRIEAGEDDP
jgi:hypothetical protein